mgnify:CR=1 FL=1
MGAELYAAMRRGEETSLALLSPLSVDQMHRELQGEARLHVDTLMTHLARLETRVAEQALVDLLHAHIPRVRPGMSAGQIDLFGRLR